MKKITIKITLVCILAAWTTSCSKKIDEAYANPNADVRVAVEQLLPQIISAMAANYAGHGTMNDARYVGQYIQNWAYFGTLSNFDRMGFTNTDVAQSVWRMHYYDIGQNNVKMILWAEEEEKWDYAGVGKAIFAWSWLMLTDYHGEVILKEAFNTSKLTFKYDTQQEVYEHVRQLCHEAIAYLNRTDGAVNQANLAKGDAYFYNGDVNKWKKFVYGVLARSFNHLTNKAEYKPDSVIKYTNLAMTTNADNAMVKFAATSISATNNFFGPLRANLVAGSTVSPTGIRQGAYMADLVSGVNAAFPIADPRAWYLLRGNLNGTIRGVSPNRGQNALDTFNRPENFWGAHQRGTTANHTAPNGDADTRFIFKNAAPFPIMTASEIQFMKAEAAFLKNDKATALMAYTEGIRQHFDMLMTTYNVSIPAARVITPAMRDAFLADPLVVPATAAQLTLSKIMMQKYIAMFGYGVLETWTDMRRYHYIDPDPETGQQIYFGFVVPSGTDLFPENGGEPVYRMRPRFNSEYVWNVVELQRIGAMATNYHVQKPWFAQE